MCMRDSGTAKDLARSGRLAQDKWRRQYGTPPWKNYGEGPTKVTEGSFHDTDTRSYTADDFRFTKKGDSLYAIEMAWPSNHEASIRSLGHTL